MLEGLMAEKFPKLKKNQTTDANIGTNLKTDKLKNKCIWACTVKLLRAKVKENIIRVARKMTHYF